jgi:membrane-bound lytic murein transglycosylase B
MQFSSNSLRLDRRALLLGLLSLGAAGRPVLAQAEDFQAFVQSLWPQAEAAGVSRETFERATAELAPDPAVVVKPKVQSEFTVSIPAYLAGAVTTARVERGRSLAKELSPVLQDVEKRFGVPGEVPLAILAIESNFGTATGGSDVLRVLATLAWKGHMAEKLKEEFVAALLMLQEGFPRSRLRGSWAGAMGMPQFLPSTYRKFAVRHAGEGVADIWGSRQDALASIASFLAGSGWVSGLSWGYETRVPENFDYANFDMDFAKFRSLGFARPDGAAALPASGPASLYLPTGAAGPAFLLTDNWEVVRQYNTSDAYALAVGVLGDRIAGRDTPAKPWPKVTPLATADIVKMQQALAQKGFYQGAQDGKLGRGMRNAIHAWQLSAGVSPADGFATHAVLEKLLAGQ